MAVNLTDNTPNWGISDRNQMKAFRKIGNRTIKQLVAANKSLLLFPPQDRDEDRQGLLDESILQYYDIDDEKLNVTTGNVMGFIGVDIGKDGESKIVDININSRFAKEGNGKEDHFLHYMLQRVFDINLFDLKHGWTDADTDFEWRIYFFPHYLKEALSQGLYKEYQRFEHNDARVKGAIDVCRFVRQDVPFCGKVAYNTREFSYDNSVTQLIRHTIEYIRRNPFGKALFASRADLREDIIKIVAATPLYHPEDRLALIKKNQSRPVTHPYFTKYRDLQTLCLQILRREGVQYAEDEKNKVAGILFNGAWLWEEYLDTVFRQYNLNLTHPHNKTGEGAIYLATHRGFPRYPDFYKHDADCAIVLDAKYKTSVDTRDDINQMVTYLYRLKGKYGAFVLPSQYDYGETVPRELEGYGKDYARLVQIYHRIPQQTDNYSEFVHAMEHNECKLAETIANKMKTI